MKCIPAVFSLFQALGGRGRAKKMASDREKGVAFFLLLPNYQERGIG